MILVDVTRTSHSRARTGIQRVCRALVAELAADGTAAAVCFDPYRGTWRRLNSREDEVFRAGPGHRGGPRGARWTLMQKVTGRARRLLGPRPELPPADALLCPELFSAEVAAQLPALFAAVRGPRVAIFHDALGLKFPELTPRATVARLPSYLRELLQFDGVVAVSEDSAASLRDYWSWLGVADPPPVRALPNALDPGPVVPGRAVDPSPPRILCVGTIEGRKNHAALLAACERLWQAGEKFDLQLVGLARPDTAASALGEIRRLQNSGRTLRYDGAVSDEALATAYANCTFTVYPSLAEGFGLPVMESLARGRPCICSANGALGELARDGGCIALASLDAASLAAAISRLLASPVELAALSAAAQARTFPTWPAYRTELLEWMRQLPRRH
jgi:glycosyltransferase involved in cell wall biosynthesis